VYEIVKYCFLDVLFLRGVIDYRCFAFRKIQYFLKKISRIQVFHA
jgi:hypothetical protein